MLIMETELWPNFLRECKAREIPVALVNGRISKQSFRRYSLVTFFLKKNAYVAEYGRHAIRS